MASATVISYRLHQPNAIAHHQIQINIVRSQTLQTTLDAFTNNMMPCVIQLGRQPYLFSGNSRIFDPLPHFMLVPVCERGIDMAIAFLQRNSDGVTDLVGLALPGAKTDGWDLVASAESEGFAVFMQVQSGLRAGIGLVCGEDWAHEVMFEVAMLTVKLK